jgi:hypothetical protein
MSAHGSPAVEHNKIFGASSGNRGPQVALAPVSLAWKLMERAAGIEPASLAWKAKVLPLNHARLPRFPIYHALGAPGTPRTEGKLLRIRLRIDA